MAQSAARKRANAAKNKAKRIKPRDLTMRARVAEEEARKKAAAEREQAGTLVVQTLEEALEKIREAKPEGEPEAYIIPWEVKHLIGSFLAEYPYKVTHNYCKALQELKPLKPVKKN